MKKLLNILLISLSLLQFQSCTEEEVALTTAIALVAFYGNYSHTYNGDYYYSVTNCNYDYYFDAYSGRRVYPVDCRYYSQWDSYYVSTVYRYERIRVQRGLR